MLLRKKSEKGFTLVELLIVIGIIGLIAGIALALMNGARKSGRDTKRKADIEQLQKALSLYYQEYGIYPPLANGSPTGVDDSLFGSSLQSIMNTIPRDPNCNSGTTCNYQIQYDGTQTTYAIKIPFEKITVCKVMSERADANALFNGTPVCNY